jgi:hypothetical protein
VRWWASALRYDGLVFNTKSSARIRSGTTLTSRRTSWNIAGAVGPGRGIVSLGPARSVAEPR